MTLDVRGVFEDAWRMWKRDRDVLLGVAGLFLFLPHLVISLFVPSMPLPSRSGSTDAAAVESWINSLQIWSAQYAPIQLGATLVLMFGVLTICILYLERRRPDAGMALAFALAALPRYLATILLVSVPVNIGLVLFYLPGIYAMGRLMLAVPALVAERPVGVVGAISRSVSLTTGNGLVMAGFACIALIGPLLLAMPFEMLESSLDGAPMANPLVALLLGAGAAAGASVAMLAAILIEVALYRRLSASKGI